MTLKTGLGVRQGHWKCHHSIECIWLPVNVPQQPWAYLLPISYRFRDIRRFQSKITKFSNPVYFSPPLKGFPLEFGIGAAGQKLEWWGYRADKEVWRYRQPFG